jgi:large subunit ribosomal protein L28
MARVCVISGRGPLSGNKRSHSEVATRRRWNLNLHTYTIMVQGKPQKIKMSTRAHRTLIKNNAKVSVAAK